MPLVSAKRQITLPVDQCRAAGIEPGDEYQSFVDNNGHITVIKKVAGSAFGLLSDVVVDDSHTDNESLQSTLIHDSN